MFENWPAPAKLEAKIKWFHFFPDTVLRRVKLAGVTVTYSWHTCRIITRSCSCSCRERPLDVNVAAVEQRGLEIAADKIYDGRATPVDSAATRRRFFCVGSNAAVWMTCVCVVTTLHCVLAFTSLLREINISVASYGAPGARAPRLPTIYFFS